MEEFCDVTLVSNNEKIIPDQKVVLASTHTVFRDLFQSDEEEDDYQVIHIKGVKSSFMTAMVDLVYDGETKVKKTECEEFLHFLMQYKLLKYNSNENN